MGGTKSLAAKLVSFIKRKTSQRYKFDQQFENDEWSSLNGLPELARYSIIAGYIRFFTERPSVLDLGCGEGILRGKVGDDITKFTGIDFSAVAISKAQQYADELTSFEVGDLNSLNVSGKYDAIVYNESLYYLKRPVQKAEVLLPHLNANGIFIFSIVDKKGVPQQQYWQELDSVFALVDSTRVFNSVGHSWTIQVYRRLGS